jgi:hypothetical protein
VTYRFNNGNVSRRRILGGMYAAQLSKTERKAHTGITARERDCRQVLKRAQSPWRKITWDAGNISYYEGIFLGVWLQCSIASPPVVDRLRQDVPT